MICRLVRWLTMLNPFPRLSSSNLLLKLDVSGLPLKFRVWSPETDSAQTNQFSPIGNYKRQLNFSLTWNALFFLPHYFSQTSPTSSAKVMFEQTEAVVVLAKPDTGCALVIREPRREEDRGGGREAAKGFHQTSPGGDDAHPKFYIHRHGRGEFVFRLIPN